MEYLTRELARKLNFFSVRYRVSKYYSPRIIVYKENLDCNKYLEFALGECIQVLNKPKKSNTNVPRILDYLFLRTNVSK